MKIHQSPLTLPVRVIKSPNHGAAQLSAPRDSREVDPPYDQGVPTGYSHYGDIYKVRSTPPGEFGHRSRAAIVNGVITGASFALGAHGMASQNMGYLFLAGGLSAAAGSAAFLASDFYDDHLNLFLSGATEVATLMGAWGTVSAGVGAYLGTGPVGPVVGLAAVILSSAFGYMVSGTNRGGGD